MIPALTGRGHRHPLSGCAARQRAARLRYDASAMRASIGRTATLAPTCAGLLLLLGGCAAAPRAIEPDMDAVERARFEAMTRQDLETLRPMLADELVYCHSDGRCESREQFLATIATGTIRYRVIVPREMRVRRFGATAIINGRADIEGLAGERAVSMRVVYMDAYVWRDGRWQLVAWQSTRLP